MALITIPSSGLWGTIAGWLNTNFATLHDADIQLGWKDNIQRFASAKGAAAVSPTWQDVGNGLYAYKFTVGDERNVEFHNQHDYALGTDVYPHVHFFVDSTMTAGQQITWEVGYVLARGHAQGESLTAAQTVFSMTYTATGAEVAGEHIVLECSDLQAFDFLEPDSIVMMRFTLLSENVTGNIYGIMADLHYQTEMLNTANKAPDFYT